MLASASPRRAQLLRAAGFSFDTLAVDIDERVRPGEPPAEYVRRLAAEKSAAAQCRLPQDAVVLGADTAVVVDGDVLGKPRDSADAERMLRRLSGRRHEVMTGVSVRRGDTEIGRVETTGMHCRVLSDADVSSYVASGEGRDKAGAYALQGWASRFVLRIDGSYSNVVGLPMACACELLRRVWSTSLASR